MEGKCTFFTWWWKQKFVDVLAEKKVTLSWLVNSKMVKPELFDHPHLVHHFTTPLKRCQSFLSQILILLNVLKPEPIEVVGHWSYDEICAREAILLHWSCGKFKNNGGASILGQSRSFLLVEDLLFICVFTYNIYNYVFN